LAGIIARKLLLFVLLLPLLNALGWGFASVLAPRQIANQLPISVGEDHGSFFQGYGAYLGRVTRLPMLVAFELSAVLLVVAELGYLGFFIGGGFLYAPPDSDTQPLLTAGAPELGQMLSQFFGLLNRTPWVAISAGLLVFAALAGFTLLGEGLRRRLDVTRARRRWLPFTRTRQPRADGLPGTEVYRARF